MHACTNKKDLWNIYYVDCKVCYSTTSKQTETCSFHLVDHRGLKLDGAIGHFAEPLWRLKTGHFTTYTVLTFEAS